MRAVEDSVEFRYHPSADGVSSIQVVCVITLIFLEGGRCCLGRPIQKSFLGFILTGIPLFLVLVMWPGVQNTVGIVDELE